MDAARHRGYGREGCLSDVVDVKAKVVEPDSLPVEITKIGLQHDESMFLEFYRLAIVVWREGEI